MKAYELADFMEQNCVVMGILLGEVSCLTIITTLRQEADRIAELEKDLALKTRDRDVFREFTLAYEERIAELEKSIQDGIQSFGVLQEQMLKEKLFGAEPVAWMDKNGVPSTIKSDLYSIPLYTTPQIKELSDEEIREIFEKNWLDLKDYKEFARLILKKASEK